MDRKYNGGGGQPTGEPSSSPAQASGIPGRGRTRPSRLDFMEDDEHDLEDVDEYASIMNPASPANSSRSAVHVRSGGGVAGKILRTMTWRTRCAFGLAGLVALLYLTVGAGFDRTGQGGDGGDGNSSEIGGQGGGQGGPQHGVRGPPSPGKKVGGGGGKKKDKPSIVIGGGDKRPAGDSGTSHSGRSHRDGDNNDSDDGVGQDFNSNDDDDDDGTATSTTTGISSTLPSKPNRPPYHVPKPVHDEFIKWSTDLHHTTEIDTYTGGEPAVHYSKFKHPRKRVDRFPSVQQRIQYYMGKWYDASESTPMYGFDFHRKVWAAQRTTRKFGIMASFAVNLFNMTRKGLVKCDAEENSVLHAYCRDYVDFAILHSGGGCTSTAIQHLGDSIPASFHKDVRISEYPVVNKVRHFCSPTFREQTGDDLNPQCSKGGMIDTIVWPMNRHRHLTPAAKVADFDVPWSEKRGKAIWRGGSNDPFGMKTKWELVGRYVNSTLIDAKFAKRSNKRGRGKNKEIPEEYIGPFIDQGEQLRNRYMISIEGNDVSSGLKWMLFSNSVVLLPPTTYESWAMEGLLEPFVHYIPIKSDASDVEEKVKWAEDNEDEAQKIAERSTLFMYDLLFHPDALRDEQAVLEGIVERFETNFGSASTDPIKHPLSHVRLDHPKERKDRFPSVEERTQEYLGKWAKQAVPMVRGDKKNPLYSTLETNSKPKLGAEFIASGDELTKCANGDDGGKYSDEVRQLCDGALPFFDERLTYDLKGDRHPTDETDFKLGAEDDTLTSKQNRWFKRILIDDSIKVLRFGDDGASEITNFPVFANTRRVVQDASGEEATPILWQLDYKRQYELVESGLIERLDVPFKNKEPRAVWRGGFGTSPSLDTKSAEYKRRKKLVDKSLSTISGKKIDAKFILSKDDLDLDKIGKQGISSKMVAAEPEGEDEQEKNLKSMLSFRYIVATEDDFRTNEDLKWMLLSRSVVLMPKKLRFTSWFMESHLEPHVHFVPVKDNYSDVEEQIDWCEDALEYCEKISERATLFVHDMLFDEASDKDTAEVQFRMMERYSDHFGS